MEIMLSLTNNLLCSVKNRFIIYQ